MITLRILGYWETSDPDCRYPDPRGLVASEWPLPERLQIAAYLDAGLAHEKFFGYSFCRFHCGIADNQMGHAQHTDGVWSWPEGLSHYIVEHAVRLPDEFLKHVAANQFNVPQLSFADFQPTVSDEFSGSSVLVEEQVKFDAEFWIKWAKAQTTK